MHAKGKNKYVKLYYNTQVTDSNVCQHIKITNKYIRTFQRRKYHKITFQIFMQTNCSESALTSAMSRYKVPSNILLKKPLNIPSHM